MELGLFVAWVVLAFVVGIIAEKKRRSAVGWTVLALLFTPIVLLVVLALPSAASREQLTESEQP